MKKFFCLIISFFLTAIASPVIAQDAEDLRMRIESLENRLEGLETGAGENISRPGKLSIGGYGELHYNDFQNSGKSSQLDFHRFVLFFGHEFNDWIRFDSEFEVEHALSGDGLPGEVELEQAFLDFQTSRLWNLPVNFKAGIMLVPVGMINSNHEPPVFYGVERPDVDKNIIPTTWWEGGAGIYGSPVPGLTYELNLVSSLDASGFSVGSGIRGGRQKVAEAKAEDLAVTGRIAYAGVPGLKVAASFFSGDTAQGDPGLGDAAVRLWEADAQYSIGNFDFRGLYAHIDVDDADKISAVRGQTIGEKITGWYLEGAFRFLSLILPRSNQEMAVFGRYEQYNTQDEVSSGLSADPANDVSVVTVGLDYKPHPNVVIKIDYQDRDNESSSKKATDQFNVGIGYMF